MDCIPGNLPLIRARMAFIGLDLMVYRKMDRMAFLKFAHMFSQ
jgi:hypothetical protein